MINLLSKFDQRKLNLVGFLHNSDGFVTYSTLSKDLGISERIIRDDLHELKQLDHIFDIQTLPEKVKLRFHKNTGFEYISRYFIDNNLSFKIIETLFFDDDIDIEDLSELLFVSDSTLYRRLREIEPSVKNQYRLSIQANPCRLIGDEKDIRIFFITFFTEKYGNFEWPFESIVSHPDVIKLVTDVLDILDLHYEDSLLRHIRYTVTIGLHRYKLGKYLNFDIENQKLDVIKFVFKNLDVSYYSEAFGVTVNEKFLHEIFAPFLRTNVLFNQGELFTGIASNEVSSRSYFKLLKICNDLSKKYDIPMNNRDELITVVHNTFFLGDSEPHMHHLINNKKERFVNRIQKEFPHFYKDLNEHLTDFITEMGEEEDSKLLNHMIYTFVTYWDNLTRLLSAIEDKVSVFVISSIDEFHAEMIKDLIEFDFSNRVNITIAKNLEEIKKNCPIGLYDLIITNFPYTNDDSTTVICVDDFPSKYDKLVIMEEILKILDKNTISESKNE